MFFRVESREDATRTVRTEVTVREEQRRAVMFLTTPGICPLCGNPLIPAINPLAETQSNDLALGHSGAGGTCPGPKADEMNGPRQRGDSRRLR
jgi:hypothetical protein